MKYRVLQRLSYSGRIYNKDENINVLDMYVECFRTVSFQKVVKLYLH